MKWAKQNRTKTKAVLGLKELERMSVDALKSDYYMTGGNRQILGTCFQKLYRWVSAVLSYVPIQSLGT